MIDIYVDRLWEWLISSLADLVLGLLIALASWLASRWVKRFVSRTAKRLGWERNSVASDSCDIDVKLFLTDVFRQWIHLHEGKILVVLTKNCDNYDR